MEEGRVMAETPRTDEGEIDGFPRLHGRLREELEARGVSVFLDDLSGSRALLFSGPDAGSVILVVDRTFHLRVGNGAKVVRLYYDVLGHILSDDLVQPFSLIVEEAEIPGAASRGASELANQHPSHELARQIYWDSVAVAGDADALVKRLNALGVKDPTDVLSICQVVPGSRSRLRYYIGALGTQRTARLIDFTLGVLRRFYRDVPGMRRVISADAQPVSTLRRWKVNAEVDCAMSTG